MNDQQQIARVLRACDDRIKQEPAIQEALDRIAEKREDWDAPFGQRVIALAELIAEIRGISSGKKSKPRRSATVGVQRIYGEQVSTIAIRGTAEQAEQLGISLVKIAATNKRFTLTGWFDESRRRKDGTFPVLVSGPAT